MGRNARCPCGSGKKYTDCHGTRGGYSARARKPFRSREPYLALPEVTTRRRGEIQSIYRIEFEFIDDCLALVAVLVEALGKRPPVDVRDTSFRDLACDAFEFLFAAKEALLENKPSLAFPMMRRAFESTSLCQVFIHSKEFAENWAKGGRIPNA